MQRLTKMTTAFRLSLLCFVSIITLPLIGQEQINGSLPFQTDPSKDYSIFIPSSYEEGKDIAAFVALHPWNTQNWDGRRWCEEISDFAEANSVILICPDGGADGQIDDPIDTAFTTVMVDSAMIWYSIAPDSLYAMGFSWGGKTTYTYGLNHANKFAGFMPIGAATSVSDINGISDQALEKPFYVIHGSNDSPNTRFYPMIERLENEGAIVESNLLQGVGHTIFFPNQVEVLTDGYNWLKENSASTVDIDDQLLSENKLILTKENYNPGAPLEINDEISGLINIYTLQGVLVKSGSLNGMNAPNQIGIYIVNLGNLSQKIIVTP